MRIADMPHRLALLARHGPVGEAGRGGAAVLPLAAHRAIVCVDVEGFGDQRRTIADQVAVREGLYCALGGAFAKSGVRWADCYREDRGDGVLVLVPPQVPKAVLVTRVPLELAAALARHNRGAGARRGSGCGWRSAVDDLARVPGGRTTSRLDTRRAATSRLV
jgi:hypothetical protein